MSHITELEADTADQSVKDLSVLKKAAERCGLVFKEDQTTFHSWVTDHGRLFGDHPLPEGRTVEDVGKCSHAMGIPVAAQQGEQHGNYEIGIVESQKFPGTYSLMYDFYGGALEKRVGDKCEDLMMFYQMEAARAAAEEQGYTYTEEQQADGTFVGTVEMS